MNTNSNETSPPLTILIADDQQLICDGISSLLSLFDDLEILETAADGQEALTLARQLHPDVVLLDIRMPRMNGIEAARIMVEEKLTQGVIMLTTFDDEEYVVKALQAGASGYLLKDLPPEELHQAILTVHRGGFQSTAAVMGKLRNQFTLPGTPLKPDTLQETQTPPSGLTPEEEHLFTQLGPREKEVLTLIGAGATNQEIAGELNLTEGTVKNYVSSLLDQMGFRNRIQAALFAARKNLTGA